MLVASTPAAVFVALEKRYDGRHCAREVGSVLVARLERATY